MDHITLGPLALYDGRKLADFLEYHVITTLRTVVAEKNGW